MTANDAHVLIHCLTTDRGAAPALALALAPSTGAVRRIDQGAALAPKTGAVRRIAQGTATVGHTQRADRPAPHTIRPRAVTGVNPAAALIIQRLAIPIKN